LLADGAVDVPKLVISFCDRFNFVAGDEAGNEKGECSTESRASGDGKKTLTQTERESGADGENRSGQEKHCGNGINTDENKNAGRYHLADPIIEIHHPLPDWQKPHREKERDDN